VSDTGSATAGGMAAALMLATSRLLASTGRPELGRGALAASNASSAHWGAELGASDVLVANTKQDCSDSSHPSEHGHDRVRETAPLRLERSSRGGGSFTD
jgi:hypothetical protein